MADIIAKVLNGEVIEITEEVTNDWYTICG
jgi:hypothetical protein